MVADFSPQEQQSFGMGNGIAGAVTPGVQLAGTGLQQYLNEASGPAPQVSPETISSQMSPYMNQYVSMALQPQLQEAANTYMLQSQAQQGAATSAGAFGDPRAAILQGNLGLNYALENQGLVGNAYNSAFNTAIGAGAQDVSNNLQGQVTNAGLQNTQLANLLTGVNTGLNQGTNATNLINTLGGQQTAQSQAGLNAAYNQYLMAQQYPFLTSQNLNQAISASGNAAGQTTTQSNTGTTSQTGNTTQNGTTTGTGTQTTQAANNAGYGLLGSLFGATGSALSGGGLGSLLGFLGNGGYVGSAGGTSGYTGSGSVSGNALYKDGGKPAVGKPAIVGEKGPEVFIPEHTGHVIPFEKVRKAVEHAKNADPKERNAKLAHLLDKAKKQVPQHSFGLAA